MHKILPQKKKQWTALVAGWQAQVDRARAAGQGASVDATRGADGSGNTGSNGGGTKLRRGFLDGHRRPGTYPRFTQRMGTNSQASASPTNIYVHPVTFPSTAKIGNTKPAVQDVTDRTQKSYKCLKVTLVFKPFCEYLSNTTKKRISTPNKLNTVLHFASVVTLVVAQIVLLGTYFIALAPRARATRAFFQELRTLESNAHSLGSQRDAEADTGSISQRATKREALIQQWQGKVQTLSGMYAAGLTAYLLLMAGFVGTTVAYYLTRRPQDAWWGWLNWTQAVRDARDSIRGDARVPISANLGTLGSADSFGPFKCP